MANESLKAKLEAYEAACAKSYAKTPERVGLKHNKVYTPLDIEVLIMKGTSASRANIHTPAAYSRPCTAAVSGPCVCMQASLPLKNPTSVIVT